MEVAHLTEGGLDLARAMADRLAHVPGVAAVAVGGSWARDQQDAHSDLDLGIYYDASSRPSLAALSEIARASDDRHPAKPLTDFGGWGPWIDGGGWLVVGGRRVDWIYRDLDRVARAIEDASEGRISMHYQPGHPHAFHTHMYGGEVHHAKILCDGTGRLARLQALTRPYPPALRHAVIDGFLWEAGFALDAAEKSADRGDVFHVTGSLFRSVSCLVQVLFAVNDRWFVNEKRAVETVGGFPLRPAGFLRDVREVMARPGADAPALGASLAVVRRLVVEVQELAAPRA